MTRRSWAGPGTFRTRPPLGVNEISRRDEPARGGNIARYKAALAGVGHLAMLSQDDLLHRIRTAAEDPELVLWEMLGGGAIPTPVAAGPQVARVLGVSEGMIIAYKPGEEGVFHVGPLTRLRAAGLTGEEIDPEPPAGDKIGRARWLARREQGKVGVGDL